MNSSSCDMTNLDSGIDNMSLGTFAQETETYTESVINLGGRIIYTRGRPPWYDTQGKHQKPYLIGICGGSASGKTTVARAIIESLDVPWVSMLSMDSYYKALTPEDRELVSQGDYNFDHPNAVDFILLHQHLTRLKAGKSIPVPEYDFKTHSRTQTTKMLYGADVIIFEGVLAFYYDPIVKLIDLRVFVDTDADERLSRRIRRDIVERGRDMETVLTQYNRYVKPAYEQFIAPCTSIAHLIIPRGGSNQIALGLIIQFVKNRLDEYQTKTRYKLKAISSKHMRQSSSSEEDHCPDESLLLETFQFIKNNPLVPANKPLPHSLHILPYSKQFHALQTIIRNKMTSQDSFIFHSDRLLRPLFEFASNLLPYEPCQVEMSDGIMVDGIRRKPETQVYGCSILRAGEALEHAFCAVYKNARVGKILIQTNQNTMEPELHYLRLPSNIKDSYVFLLDATVASGAAAIMAIRILLEHDVPENHIFLVPMLMALQGVYTVAYTFPRVQIVTTAIDERLSDDFHILPGIGNFGDRYFGTGS